MSGPHQRRHSPMNVSPTSTSGSTSSSLSSASHSTLQLSHGLSSILRRRSVDTGGLNLALNDHEGSGSGRGYGGWVENTQALSGSMEVAELVIAMHEQTNSLIDQACPTSTTFGPALETNAKREKLILKLATWHFDASHLPPDEVLLCTTLLFELLWSIESMEEDIGLSFDTILPFLARVSKIYREKTSYHNFHHALDVLQAVYCYLHQAGCIPSIQILYKEDPKSVRLSSAGDSEKETPAADIEVPTLRRQAMWRKPQSEGATLLQRSLRNQDIFALFVAAIGHDIGHPGLSNAFMKNAKTPLAELFEDKSVLEKMHCTLLLQVMRKHGMGHLLDRLPPRLTHETGFSSVSIARQRTGSDSGALDCDIIGVLPGQHGNSLEPPQPSMPSPTRPVLSSIPASHGLSEIVSEGTGSEFRNLLIKTILVTDMSVHFKWMLEFEQLVQWVQRDAEDDLGKKAQNVDPQTRLLLCQALIKCADISNPSRPPPVCKHWSFSLLAEWAQQSLLEAQLALPISTSACDDPIKAAAGQVDFINMSTLPLLRITSSIVPEMDVFVKQCESNLLMWRAKVDEHNTRPALDKTLPPELTPPASTSFSSPLVLPTSPPDVSTMFALSLPAALYTPSTDTCQPWLASDHRASLPPVKARPADEEAAHVDRHLNGSNSSDPTPPPSPSRTASVPPTAHHHRSSHTELPQVSIPSGSSVPFSLRDPLYAKSCSTTASTSPLFSPRSMPTSSSSPRSDISVPASGPNATTGLLGLQSRPALRAAYDAHGRPKAAKRLENRTSWQGRMPSTNSSPGGSDWSMERTFDPTAPRQASHGS